MIPTGPVPVDRGRLAVRGAGAAAAIIGSSIGIGLWAGGGGFDWSVWALVLTAFATLTLAGGTAYLAASTWQDVRWSQQMAKAANEANELARSELQRRPRLTLLADEEKLHSRSEIEGTLTVRLLVANAPSVRAAIGARVLVDRCIAPAGEVVTFGSPALGWASAAATAHDEAVVIFAGATRVLDLGTLIRRGSDKPSAIGWAAPDAPRKKAEAWELKIGLPLVGGLRDGREHVGTGTTIRVVVGSDESDAVFYDVLVGWQTGAPDTAALLSSLSVLVKPAQAFASST